MVGARAGLEWEGTGTSFIVRVSRGGSGGVSLEEAMWASRRHIQTLRSTDSRTASEQSYWSGLGAQKWQEMSSTSFITPQIICCLLQTWHTIANFRLAHTLAQVLDVHSPLPPHPTVMYIFIRIPVFSVRTFTTPRGPGERVHRGVRWRQVAV